MVLKIAKLERERKIEFVKAKLIKRIKFGAVYQDLIEGLLKNKDESVLLLL